jgi:hypothetical protein
MLEIEQPLTGAPAAQQDDSHVESASNVPEKLRSVRANRNHDGRHQPIN